MNPRRGFVSRPGTVEEYERETAAGSREDGDGEADVCDEADCDGVSAADPVREESPQQKIVTQTINNGIIVNRFIIILRETLEICLPGNYSSTLSVRMTASILHL
jgi:hypothetical protein